VIAADADESSVAAIDYSPRKANGAAMVHSAEFGVAALTANSLPDSSPEIS
jgi:hypothetical protein